MCIRNFIAKIRLCRHHLLGVISFFTMSLLPYPAARERTSYSSPHNIADIMDTVSDKVAPCNMYLDDIRRYSACYFTYLML